MDQKIVKNEDKILVNTRYYPSIQSVFESSEILEFENRILAVRQLIGSLHLTGPLLFFIELMTLLVANFASS